MIATCQHCKTEFPNSMSATQAHGCACHVHAGKIRGHYGSDHDLCEYGVIAGDPLPDMDPICDACVDKLIADGRFAYTREHLDFEGVR